MSEENKLDTNNQVNSEKLDVRLNREESNGDILDILYVGNKPVVTFNVSSIDELNLVHTKQTMIDCITDYLIPTKK